MSTTDEVPQSDERSREEERGSTIHAFSYMECLPEVDEYLATIEISNENPALLLEWRRENLHWFVDAANEDAAFELEVPDWFSHDVGDVTAESVIEDIMGQLEACSGGRLGVVCLAPNTTDQIIHIASRLADIGWHPFIQYCTRAVPDNDVILAIAALGEHNTAAAAMPLNVSYYGVRQFYK